MRDSRFVCFIPSLCNRFMSYLLHCGVVTEILMSAPRPATAGPRRGSTPSGVAAAAKAAALPTPPQRATPVLADTPSQRPRSATRSAGRDWEQGDHARLGTYFPCHAVPTTPLGPDDNPFRKLQIPVPRPPAATPFGDEVGSSPHSQPPAVPWGTARVRRPVQPSPASSLNRLREHPSS